VIRISEEEIIRAFRDNDRVFISTLYAKYLPVITRFVNFNNGLDGDAKDLIQQAFLIILQKTRNNEFELSCTFKTYLYAICKNLWLKELRREKVSNKTCLDPDEVENVDVDIEFEKEYKSNAQYFLFRWHYHKLSKICQKLIKMVLEKQTHAEIAKELGFINEETARKKKYRCKESLIKQIKNDPRYKGVQ